VRFASLGSGSSGNATLIQSQDTTIMLDCGFSCKETVKRLERLDINPEQIDAIVVTHEHNDHISGVGVFSRKYKTPVWMNYGTSLFLRQKKLGDLAALNLFNSHQNFHIKNLNLQPFPVPHDAREAVQFIFSGNNKRLAIVTDLGHITPHTINQLSALNALILESNHDLTLLRNGTYRDSLKRRVGGNYGHLNNHQAADLLRHIDITSIQHLIAAHLSTENNTPEHAISAFKDVLGTLPEWFHVAQQDSGFSWKEII